MVLLGNIRHILLLLAIASPNKKTNLTLLPQVTNQSSKYFLLLLFAKVGQSNRLMLPLPTYMLLQDNHGSLALLHCDFFNIKHWDVKYKYLFDLVKNKEVTLNYVLTADMVTDILTEPLPTSSHQKHRQSMGIVLIAKVAIYEINSEIFRFLFFKHHIS
ncbi:uncharacterized protein NDAI_0K01090 [Naumovozyma dairenensis CBS 421]|uniref:Telomere replication protein EST3 n=1 Tax=Naumovozyma dairenensis (strain ATCC 10597 / BCRC 20456 / CBS 421 / NBRC 0211 / NRRL Y-12639) TaxID=1071378 RepID=G0WHN9_NAUDC|nr:hypothetical protein NDAI_0K01090 [Naumovozyma dairenensis CBS 421]CCD27300.1 hypothetical protein NDAI_0K01090 [Naumovozyma dairenensis CBS 421]